MNRYILILLFTFLISAPKNLFSQNNKGIQQQAITTFVYKQLCTPNPSPEAKALYKYLQNISGEKILSGQMSTPEGIQEIDYIMDVTVKKPAIRGFDLKSEKDNEMEIRKAIEWWQTGGIPLFMWNWTAPTYEEGNENSKKKIEIEKCFQEGTPEHESFWKELKTKADHLDSLRIANVPVLWCPFDEQNSTLFWWGKEGPAPFIKLWQTMYNYFVNERKLNNLIWVQCFSDDVTKAWYPGNNYVDIVGISSYKDDAAPQPVLFEKARVVASSNIIPPVAYNECATMPNIDECVKTGTMWCWWMQRPDTYLAGLSKEFLNDTYYNDYTITLKEVPNIVKDYSGETVKRYYTSGTTISFNELKGFDFGTKSGITSITNDELKIEAKGIGVQGVKDEFYFAFKQIEGDFDISVQVLSLSPVNIYTMAGIMARTDLSKKSSNVLFQVFPDNNSRDRNQGGCELKYRTEKSNQTLAIYPGSTNEAKKFFVDFPNTWIRLKRRGNIFKSYISHDGSNWQIYSVHSQQMPENLLVGLAVASNNNKISTKADFKNLEITWE